MKNPTFPDQRRPSRARSQYETAARNGLEYIATCSSVSYETWQEMMKGAVKANGKRVRALIKKHLPDLYYNLALEFYNPYEPQTKRKNGMFIYVHSGIEYFLKIN